MTRADVSMSSQDSQKVGEIRIKFFGPIVAIVNRSEDAITLARSGSQGMTVRGLVEVLCSRYGASFRDIAIHNGELNSGLVISVNGECVVDGSRELSLRDQVQLLIASQMSGG